MSVRAVAKRPGERVVVAPPELVGRFGLYRQLTGKVKEALGAVEKLEFEMVKLGAARGKTAAEREETILPVDGELLKQLSA
jgi:hypothetical protein